MAKRGKGLRPKDWRRQERLRKMGIDPREGAGSGEFLHTRHRSGKEKNWYCLSESAGTGSRYDRIIACFRNKRRAQAEEARHVRGQQWRYDAGWDAPPRRTHVSLVRSSQKPKRGRLF